MIATNSQVPLAKVLHPAKMDLFCSIALRVCYLVFSERILTEAKETKGRAMGLPAEILQAHTTQLLLGFIFIFRFPLAVQAFVTPSSRILIFFFSLFFSLFSIFLLWILV